MKGTFNALPTPKDREIAWLLDMGIGDDALTLPWPIRGSAVRFQRGGLFDFQDDDGSRAIIFRAEDRGECIDLIAWSPRSGKIAAWRNKAFCLGDLDQLFNPATWFMGGTLKVHKWPLEWLRANRQGVCIVRPEFTYAYLRHCPRLRFADAVHARRVRSWLQPPKPNCKFLVEQAQDERAAA